jgi:hypothetical protein
MPTYSVKTAFTQDDLTRFAAAGSNVVVAKPNAGGAPNVAWVVYRPLLQNTMSWEEKYGIYASSTDLTQGGALLTQMSKTDYPAIEARIYPLNVAGFFGASSPGGSPGSFYAQNNYNNLDQKGYLTFGLYQDALVNGTKASGNAVSAAVVNYNFMAEMTPFTTIYLWMQSQVTSNSVLTTVTSPQTSVTFGGSVTDVSLQYDAKTGTFVPAPSAKLPAGIELDHHVPTLL